MAAWKRPLTQAEINKFIDDCNNSSGSSDNDLFSSSSSSSEGNSTSCYFISVFEVK